MAAFSHVPGNVVRSASVWPGILSVTLVNGSLARFFLLPLTTHAERDGGSVLRSGPPAAKYLWDKAEQGWLTGLDDPARSRRPDARAGSPTRH
jgi:hypothetical protein